MDVMFPDAGFFKDFRPQERPDVIAAAGHGLVDYCAASFAAAGEEGVKRLLQTQTCTGRARLIGQSKTASSEFAALFNGYQAHLLDFDDSHSDVRGHPSAVILSALLAHVTSSTAWDHFLNSYIVGVEAMARLGILFSSEHYVRGWHSTATIGGIAAGVALAYLYGLDGKDMATCCAFAATQSGGMRNQFGTDAKPLHVGLAAQNASRALRFTRVGLNAKHDWFYGERGFLRLYHGQENPKIFSDIGREYRIVQPGLWFKMDPFCSAALPGKEAALRVAESLKDDGCVQPLSETAIDYIDVAFAEEADAALTEHDPSTGREGKFSIEYIVALVLLGRPLDHKAFGRAALEPDAATLMKKVRRSYVSRGRRSFASLFRERFATVKVVLTDGRIYQATSRYSSGASPQAVTEDDLVDKLVSHAGEERAEKLWVSISTKNLPGLLGLL